MTKRPTQCRRSRLVPLAGALVLMAADASAQMPEPNVPSLTKETPLKTTQVVTRPNSVATPCKYTSRRAAYDRQLCICVKLRPVYLRAALVWAVE